MKSCRRNCKFGYLGTEEIYLNGQPLTEGRIGLHVEFVTRLEQRTSVRLCPCQTRPEGMDWTDAERKGKWRLDR